MAAHYKRLCMCLDSMNEQEQIGGIEQDNNAKESSKLLLSKVASASSMSRLTRFV